MKQPKKLDENIQTTFVVDCQRNCLATNHVGGSREWWPTMIVGNGKAINQNFGDKKCGGYKVSNKKCGDRKLTIEKMVIEKCHDQKVNNQKCGDENLWWLKPMAIENLAIKTYGDRKPTDKMLRQWKFWWLNFCGNQNYGDKKTFQSSHGLRWPKWL